MQLTVSELIKELRKIESKAGGGERLVSAYRISMGDKDPEQIIVERAVISLDGEVVLTENS